MPLGECFLGASRCPRCARAEEEGNPVVDRHGTMHSPERMRNSPRQQGQGRFRPGDNRCRVCGTMGQVNPKTGRMFCPATIMHKEERKWRRDNPSLLLLGNPPVMLLRKEDRKNLPPLYSQEHNPDPTVWVKLFTPYSSYTFYITEFDGTDTMFGWTDPGPGGDAELGYISLSELAALRGPMGLQGVERDRSWRPVPLSKVKGRMVNPLGTCECEHTSHFRDGLRYRMARRGQQGPPGHAYGERSGVLHPTKTAFGTFNLCAACIRDGHGTRLTNPSAPSRIKNAWEKFHQTGFAGKAKEIPDIPGVPKDLMELGKFVDAVTDDAQRFPARMDSRLCYEPGDKSLWVVDTKARLVAERFDGQPFQTVAYRTFGKSGKDHAVYEHRFHRPHPVLQVVHPRAALFDGGRYIVSDWIRK